MESFNSYHCVSGYKNTYRLKKQVFKQIIHLFFVQRRFSIWSRQKLNTVSEVVSKLLNLSANIIMK